MGKRVFDVAVSAAALVILSPVLALVAAAVKLDSPGPVIFRQVRVGRGGRLFRISKFRTMSVAPPGRAGPDITVEGDARVTRVGRLLRATKLDELPQLVDVLRGDMSLVGPRPELPAYVDRWPAQARATILSVRPGITDPASVAYRHESEQLASAPDPESYYLVDGPASEGSDVRGLRPDEVLSRGPSHPAANCCLARPQRPRQRRGWWTHSLSILPSSCLLCSFGYC